MVTDSGEINQGDGEDLARHRAYGKGSADVEGVRCWPTCHLGVKGVNEYVIWLLCSMVTLFQVFTFINKLARSPTRKAY